jgi:signal peptidase I
MEGGCSTTRPTAATSPVFKLPRDGRTDYIKRVVGLPGDRVQVRGGAVYVNGQAVSRERAGEGVAQSPFGFERPVDRIARRWRTGTTYITHDLGPGRRGRTTPDVYTVPAGHFFMMGDNRDNSVGQPLPARFGGWASCRPRTWSGKAEMISSRGTPRPPCSSPGPGSPEVRESRFFGTPAVTA